VGQKREQGRHQAGGEDSGREIIVINMRVATLQGRHQAGGQDSGREIT
jgi:hypothetical protein